MLQKKVIENLGAGEKGFSYSSHNYNRVSSLMETFIPPFNMDQQTWRIYEDALRRRYAPQNPLTMPHLVEILGGGINA